MGNTIRMHEDHTNVEEWLSMSNGATSVLLSVLVFSGSSLAQSDKEKELIIWLAEYDQGLFGSGTVGFDISDMPWNKESFTEEKAFLLSVVDRAIEKSGWELLGYEPDEEIALGQLATFRDLIQKFDAKHINPAVYTEWSQERAYITSGFPVCEIEAHVWMHCVQ